MSEKLLFGFIVPLLLAPSGRAQCLNTDVTTLAGMPGIQGSLNGTGASASFNRPDGVAADLDGNLYVADTANHLIRKIAPGGIVTTYAGRAGVAGSADGVGGAARFNLPQSVATDGEDNV